MGFRSTWMTRMVRNFQIPLWRMRSWLCSSKLLGKWARKIWRYVVILGIMCKINRCWIVDIYGALDQNIEVRPYLSNFLQSDAWKHVLHLLCGSLHVYELTFYVKRKCSFKRSEVFCEDLFHVVTVSISRLKSQGQLESFTQFVSIDIKEILVNV
jgi:hypothetical protein